MKRVLLLDTETTNTDHKTGAIVEVACILYSLQYATPITSFAAIVHGKSNAAEHINGIAPCLMKEASSPALVSGIVDELIVNCDAIVAHCAAFDRGFMLDVERDWGLNLRTKPWICSMRDIEWPKPSKSRALISIALQHGVTVVSAHRAYTDCDILARLLTRVHETGTDLELLMERAMRPKVLVEALTNKEDRDIVYANGFDWNDRTRQSLREMPEEDISALPFKCRIIDKTTVTCSGTRDNSDSSTPAPKRTTSPAHG